MFIRSLIESIFGLIPTFSFDIPRAIYSISEWAFFMNRYVPMDVALQCLALLFVTHLICSSVKVVLDLL